MKEKPAVSPTRIIVHTLVCGVIFYAVLWGSQTLWFFRRGDLDTAFLFLITLSWGFAAIVEVLYKTRPALVFYPVIAMAAIVAKIGLDAIRWEAVMEMDLVMPSVGLAVALLPLLRMLIKGGRLRWYALHGKSPAIGAK